jgi:chromosome segregation ATPase
MADDQTDLRFLGEQIKRVQGDVRVLKTDVAQLRADRLRLTDELAGLRANLMGFELRMDALAERLDAWFRYVTELIEANTRATMERIDLVGKERSPEEKIERFRRQPSH